MATQLENATNDGQATIESGAPYSAIIRVKGTAPFLFHRWSVDGVEAKSKAAKGSKAKKEDDLESYVYRTSDNELAVPGEYFRMSLVNAAKYKQDPRSPRKSAMDLFKAGVIALDDLCSFQKEKWDYIDRRRVTIQRSAITRCRPALLSGWELEMQMQILLPEYISPEMLNETIQAAGRLVGVGDFRPTFGRFQVVSFTAN